MQIRTNNHPRAILYWYDLTDAERADLTDAERAELDYIDTPDAQEWAKLFRYRGQVYDLGEFAVIRTRSQQARSLNNYAHTAEDDSDLARWDGIQTDSAFSGIVVRFTPDHESVVVGTCYA